MNQQNRQSSSLIMAILLAFLFTLMLTNMFKKNMPQQQGQPQQQTPQAPLTPRTIDAAFRITGIASPKAARAEIKKLQGIVKTYSKSEDAAWSQFRIAYLQEVVLKKTADAKASYEWVTKEYTRSPYAPTAGCRLAQIKWNESAGNGHKEGKKEFEKVEGIFLLDHSKVKQEPPLSPAWLLGFLKTPPQSLVHYPDKEPEPIMEAVCRQIEPLNQREPLYQVLHLFVKLCGENKHFSYALAIILFGAIVKLLLQPLNKASFKSMREMQKIQPEIKKIQEKYKGDKSNPQKMNQEMMALYKAHGVNPMGGCLPMLIQMPVLILLYRAIMSYRCQFNNADFLWIHNLALPDMPLLILYGVSMIFSTKLTTMPTTDPAQQQQQKMMTWMMPIMFVMICRSFPAAFVLYWMTFNFMQTLQQVSLYRQWDREEGKEDTGGLMGRLKTLKPKGPGRTSGNAQPPPSKDDPPEDQSSASPSLPTGQRRRRRKKR